MKRILIVGATSAIAEHCARLWVAGAASMVLAGRDAAGLAVVAQDLRVRNPACAVEAATPGFEDPAAIAAFVAAVFDGGAVDIALIAHGMLPDQAQCQQDLARVQRALAINAVSPVLFAEAVAGRMAAAGRGTLAVIGSVAGDRGRQSNYVYGAAKALVDRYLQGLRHRFAGTAVRCVLVKPGPTDTPMTAPLRARGARLAPVEKVAADIVAGIARGRAVIYTPPVWRFIMLVIRHIPPFLFERTRL
jgi:decaprenylphospho-beta-D-erythro-pentofuranosid-2-ulose 2-reductase